MKISKLIFIIVLGLVIFGVLVMNYGQVLITDCIGAAIILAGGGAAVFDCLRQHRNRWVLLPLAIGILTLVAAGFLKIKYVIILAAFGYAALGLYLYLVLYKLNK